EAPACTGRRRGPPRRARGVPARRPRDRVLPVVLPWRYLRLRRRARLRMNSPLVDPACTQMFREAAAAPSAVRTQLERNRTRVAVLGERLRKRKPRAVVTCARGSSDHAATYAKYLFETRLGLVTSSAAPSVTSVYGVKQDLSDCLFLAISQ